MSRVQVLRVGLDRPIRPSLSLCNNDVRDFVPNLSALAVVVVSDGERSSLAFAI